MSDGQDDHKIQIADDENEDDTRGRSLMHVPILYT